jgi:hypothetical protein
VKTCPLCLSEPYWHNARNVTMTRRAQHYIFSGCRHAAGPKPLIVPASDCAAQEALWNTQAEALFATYTESWSDAQRATFRERIWPTPPLLIPVELFDRSRDEAPNVFSSVRLPYADDDHSPF